MTNVISLIDKIVTRVNQMPSDMDFFNRRSGLTEFIEVYRSLPELWDVNHRDYNNRLRKSECYDKLIEKLQKIEPHATRESVVRKINSLRSNFRKEWRRVEESKMYAASPEDIYKPKLWYYKDFLFLVDQESRDALYSEDFKSEEEKFQDDEGYKSGPLYQSSTALEEMEPNIREIQHPTMEQGIEPEPKRRPKKRKPRSSEDKILSCALGLLKGEENEYLIMAKSYSYKLRKMNETQRLFADHLISEILLEGQLGNLSRRTSITNLLADKEKKNT